MPNDSVPDELTATAPDPIPEASTEEDPVKALLASRKKDIERLEAQNKRLRSKLRQKQPDETPKQPAVIGQPDKPTDGWWESITGE